MTFVDIEKDLCKTCANTKSCPIYPPLNIVTHCVEYTKRGCSKTNLKKLQDYPLQTNKDLI